jgi:hypothetical protein
MIGLNVAHGTIVLHLLELKGRQRPKNSPPAAADRLSSTHRGSDGVETLRIARLPCMVRFALKESAVEPVLRCCGAFSGGRTRVLRP